MKERHLALVVEDDRENAEDLVRLLEAVDCTSVVVDNAADAERLLLEKPFCIIFLDLEIKSDRDSIKGHVENGKRVLRTVRAKFGGYNGRCFTLPVLIVSGFASEHDCAVDVYRSGAHDIIEKPLRSGEASAKIRRAFQDTDRATHASCAASPLQRRVDSNDEIVVAIPGDRVRNRRTRVTVAGNPTDLTDGSLKLLLTLVLAKQKGTLANKIDMGNTDAQGFKGISNLRIELKPALPDVNIVESRYHGDYCFIDRVRIGPCSFEKLRQIGDARISALVEELEQLPVKV